MFAAAAMPIPVRIEIDAEAASLDRHHGTTPLRMVRQIGRVEGDADMGVADGKADVDAVPLRRVGADVGQLPHDDPAVFGHARQMEHRGASPSFPIGRRFLCGRS